MPARIRIALPAAAAAFGIALGLFIVSHGRGAGASSVIDSDRTLLDSVVEKVGEVYYKPFDSRLLVKGERTGIIAVLKAHKSGTNLVPIEPGTGDFAKDEARLDQVLTTSLQSYAGRVGATEITQGALRGMLNSLHDPYTVYLTQAEIGNLEESLKGGNFGGIGVYIVEDPKSGDVVVDPIEGMPAARAGVKPGDIIVAVDGHQTHGMKLDSVERLIRGKIGTSVALLVKPRHDKNAAGRVVHVGRETIHVPSVRAKMEDGYEYVRLADFGDTSAQEVRDAMLSGKRNHAKGYILDLRDNGGGLLDTAVEISSLFIPQGPIVSTIDRDGSRDTKSALGDAIGVHPLVLLVNQYTASSSEITSGAVQDYHAGTIVGVKTFGKGVVQSLYTLPDQGALKVTTSRYVTPKGRDIHHKGITPDVVVPQSDDFRLLDTPRDKQLAAAKAILRKDSGGTH